MNVLQQAPLRLAAAALLALHSAPDASALQTSQPYVRALLVEGQTLSNGSTLNGVLDQSISDTGRWAARVDTSNGRAIVVDGDVLVAVGDTYRGEIVLSVKHVVVDESGTLALLYAVDDPLSATNLIDRLVIGGTEILSETQNVSLPAIGLNDPVTAIKSFDYEDGQLVLDVGFNTTFPILSTALLVGTTAGGVFTPTSGFLPGDAIPGLSQNLFSVTGDLDIAATGRYGARVSIGTTLTTSVDALVDNGNGIAETGGPAIPGGSTWTFTSAPRLRVNRFNNRAISGKIQLASGPERGSVYKNSAPFAIEGGAIQGLTGLVVDAFDTTSIEMTDDNDIVFSVPFTAGNELVLFNRTPILASAQTTQDGHTVDTLFAGTPLDSLAVTRNGEFVLARAEVDGGLSALLLAERLIFGESGCTQVPNSTGEVGKLIPFGSRFAAVNDFSIAAMDVPASQFGLLLVSRETDFVMNPGSSAGNLCLGGTVGRFNDLIQLSSTMGTYLFELDLTAIPQASFLDSVAPGDTWYFQAWHRQIIGGAQSAGWTEAVRVDFI